ncbi:hypothetical protein [Nesterenkonia rhizosphaerae]|uniref:Minor tail protein n=1 Tax=Nesterenkonia rhizosphaerae TaxID=1348272 RepID=A0ABP9FZK0_9MICC
MANDRVVWAVNGEVPHDARLAREQVYVSSGGATGIIGPTSLRVRPTPTPSEQVQVLPGTFVTAATAGPGLGYTNAPGQSYSKTLYQTESVTIRPTSSVGGRTDVVGIVIIDPEFEGNADSVDYSTHRFWRLHVVENAGNAATLPEHFADLHRPFIPLAQIRIPASTGTIDQSMIHDIRQLATSKTVTEPVLHEVNPSGNAQFITVPPSTTSWTEFTRTPQMTIPPWATEAVVQLKQTGGIAGATDHVGGRARAVLIAGGQRVVGQDNIFRQDSDWNRFEIPLIARLDIRALAGRSALLAVEIRRTSGTDTLRVGARPQELWQYWLQGQVTFQEKAS